MGRARDRAGSERNRRPTCRKSRASVTRRRESKPWPVLGLKPLPTSSLLLRPARKNTRESARDLPLTGKARSLPWRACAALAVHSESPHCGQRSRERPSGAPFTFCTRKTMVHRTRTRVYGSAQLKWRSQQPPGRAGVAASALVDPKGRTANGTLHHAFQSLLPVDLANRPPLLSLPLLDLGIAMSDVY